MKPNPRNAWNHTIYYFKGRVLGSIRWCSIICKCSVRQLHIPILGALTHPPSKQSSQCSVGDFCLPIRLWMVWSAKTQLSPQQLPQSLPKITHKFCVPITYNSFRNPMEAYDLLEVQCCYLACIICFMAWKEVGHLRKPIHHNYDEILAPLSSRQRTMKSTDTSSHGNSGTSNGLYNPLWNILLAFWQLAHLANTPCTSPCILGQ